MMAVLAWRLGLGWLIGRWLLLVTTADHRVAVPFRHFAGTFYVARSDAPWGRQLEASPAATIQAWPGPRSVKARPVADQDEQDLVDGLWGRPQPVIALSPTGQRSPEMTAPDLVWVWGLLLAGLGVQRLLRRL